MATKDTPPNGLPLDQVIQAIPDEINEEAPTKDPLGDLISQISSRQVPVSSLTRMWALGSMQAKIAVGYLAYAMRSSFSSKNKQQELLNEAHLKAALKLIGTMGYLRGAIMKVGQLLSNLPHLVPDEIATTLERLQFEAPPMHYALIREVFLDEFGKDPSEMFASFEKKAFAAASLGQVHRAVLHSGEQVAVKIQYPNMAATIRSDLATLRKIVMPMKLREEGRYIFSHLDDIEHMLTAETDYHGEANMLEKVRQLFTPEDNIVVPRVWQNYSCERVLTTDYLQGCHPGQFIESEPSQESRDQIGLLITRAFLRIWSRTHTMYTDPNPGNFLILDDGRLGLIDFGSVRTLTESEWQEQVAAEQSLLEADHGALDQLIAAACFFDSTDAIEPARLDMMRRLVAWQAAPVQQESPFDFGSRAFYQQGIDLYLETTRRGYLRNDSLYIWWTRLILGHRTLLYRLGSRVAYRPLYLEEKTY